jgi:NADH dehydrogenase
MSAGHQAAHRVVIVGGGFGGLYAAQSLGRAPVSLTLIDRRNFHLFQPLLYQVATGALSPGEIASPLRHVLRKQRNTEVLLGEVVDLDVERRRVILRDGEAPYDDLIVATGATHHYFGNDQWARLAPGLKTIEDATSIRRRVLLAFEQAERETESREAPRVSTFRHRGRRADGRGAGGGLGRNRQ